MCVLYHLSIANLVVDSLILLSLGNVTHIEDGKKELV